MTGGRRLGWHLRRPDSLRCRIAAWDRFLVAPGLPLTWDDLGQPGGLPGMPSLAPGGVLRFVEDLERSPAMSIQSKPTRADGRPVFTTNLILSIREVCDLTGSDRKTVTDRARTGVYANAVQDQTGRKAWGIPVADLVDAGHIDRSQVVEVAASLESLRESRQVADLRARIGELEAALKVQTALADERRTTVESLQSLIAALLPGVSR